VYVFQNIFICSANMVKTGCDGVTSTAAKHDLSDLGSVFLYHNTFIAGPKTVNMMRHGTLYCHANLHFFNNLIWGGAQPRGADQAQTRNRQSDSFGLVSADYNLYVEAGKTLVSEGKLDSHSIFNEAPVFMDYNREKLYEMAAEGEMAIRHLNPSHLDVRLKAGSPGIDSGLRLPNLNDGFTGKAPDMGAFEFDGDTASSVFTRCPPEDPRE